MLISSLLQMFGFKISLETKTQKQTNIFCPSFVLFLKNLLRDVSRNENWVLPARTDVGIECWRSRTNRNILSPAGRKPSLSANMTMPSPTGGTKTNRAKIIDAVVRRPSFELPGPAINTFTHRSCLSSLIGSMCGQETDVYKQNSLRPSSSISILQIQNEIWSLRSRLTINKIAS